MNNLRREQSKIDNICGLDDILLILKRNIFMNLNVCSLAKCTGKVKEEYSSDKGYGIIYVKPFPLNEGQSEHTDCAYVFSSRAYTEGEVVLVIYADKDFSDNVKVMKAQIKETQSEIYHSTNYGIVIPLS